MITTASQYDLSLVGDPLKLQFIFVYLWQS